jgi:hypothetical protein
MSGRREKIKLLTLERREGENLHNAAFREREREPSLRRTVQKSEMI